MSAVGGMREKAVVSEVENFSPSSGIGRAFRRGLWVEREKYGKKLGDSCSCIVEGREGDAM
jgi:hypothetical protein